MKLGIATLLVVLLATSLWAAPAAGQVDGARDLAPVVEQGTTDRFGGGAWVSVRSGDARFAVVYGTEETPNTVTIFASYRRFLGGADIVNEEGTLLRRTTLPVLTTFAQQFDRFVEFDLATDSGRDRLVPLKVLDLGNASWELRDLVEASADDAAFVNFTLTAWNLPYTEVADPLNHTLRPATAEDGVLEEFSLTFRLETRIVLLEDVPVPWYRITVASGDERRPVASEPIGHRNLTGPAVVMGAKYDHTIVGWDFVGEDSLLGLVTRLRVGTFVPRPTAGWIHLHFGGEEARSDGFSADNRTAIDEPVLLTRDRIEFVDDWYRIGRATWIADVVVDGEPKAMAFRILGAFRDDLRHEGRTFRGFGLVGVFIYPPGQVIFHDPGFEATAFLPAAADLVNLGPGRVLLLQAVVVALALVPALWLRRRRGPEA